MAHTVERDTVTPTPWVKGLGLFDATTLVTRVRGAVETFAGGTPQFDDITLLAIARDG